MSMRASKNVLIIGAVIGALVLASALLAGYVTGEPIRPSGDTKPAACQSSLPGDGQSCCGKSAPSADCPTANGDQQSAGCASACTKPCSAVENPGPTGEPCAQLCGSACPMANTDAKCCAGKCCDQCKCEACPKDCANGCCPAGCGCCATAGVCRVAK